MTSARVAITAAASLLLPTLAMLGGWGLGGCSSSRATADAGPGADTLEGDADGDAVGPTDAACNPLAQLGTPVTAVCDDGTPPAATGGAIVDGTYVLTETHFFGACSNGVLAETLAVSQGTVQSVVSEADGSLQPKTVTYTLGANGTTLAEMQTCPIRVATTVSFSATPTTLTIYLSTVLATRVSTFTLR